MKNSIELLNIDLLVSWNGFLRNDLAYGRIHLNAQGYALWDPEVD